MSRLWIISIVVGLVPFMVRIERIVSTGHTSPEGFWYDQEEHEWVVVLKGEAKLLFEDGHSVQMTPGDHILIPAHRKRRRAFGVLGRWTCPRDGSR